MKKREMAVYLRPQYGMIAGRWVTSYVAEDVIVIVRAEGYAMVKHPRAMPFVVSERDLRPQANA